MPVPPTCPDPAAALGRAGLRPGEPVGVALAPGGLGVAYARTALACPGDPRTLLAELIDRRPRLVCWSAAALEPLLRGGLRPAAVWDVAATHRLLHGGSEVDPGAVWATATGLDPVRRPRTGQLVLGPDSALDEDAVEPHQPVRPDGYLRPGWCADGPPDPGAAAGWASAALRTAEAHLRDLAQLPDPRPTPAAPPLPVLTAWSESGAEVLAVELGLTGLPLDREEASALIEARVGPPPRDADEAAAGRAARDGAVLSLVRGADDLDLRNPAQVRVLLARAGIDVPDTRSWRLEPLRGTHPVVDALIGWRKAERIATTYGWSWLARHVGEDGRLRGRWTGCDGAAGRMTASAGLHNLPAELRPAVAAEPGHRLVRADLGQIEPRVLAAVSADAGLAAATGDDDLYAPVAARLGCDRSTAKVAVLAAMYGQTSGAAGEALRGMERAYPGAMAYLRAADERGRAGEAVRTYGGRAVLPWPLPEGAEPAARAARGRFTRNAVVQGAAAELFKMWAVSVRAALPPGAEIVLCLHDELLVHVPAADATEVAALLEEVLTTTAARWAGGRHVRFVADVAVLGRWSDAKG